MNAVNILIGNICSLLAMITDSVSSTKKTAKGVLIVQNFSQLFYCVGAIVLKGYSSAVQNVVSIFRNLIAIKQINSKPLEWLLVVLGVVLGIWFNNLGIIGLLPVIANLEYTLAIFRFKDNERALKIAFAICVGLFVIFNFAILNFVGAISNLIVMVATLTVLFKKK